MTGVTIDHMISTTVFIAAILLFIGLFAQGLQAGILYQQNQHVAFKTSDLLDNILLSPGYPYNWGVTNDTLSIFGLQQPGKSGYKLSSFALMRLTSLLANPVEYPRDSGNFFNNVSFGPTGFLFIPLSDCITYETASRLLGINGTFGFQLSITPLLEVSISEYEPNPLVLEVKVTGPGSTLGYADINYYLYRAYKSGTYASLELLSGSARTNSAGVAYLNFTFDGQAESYTIVVYANLSGLLGLGYSSHQTFTQGAGVMPFVMDYEKGKVYLAHSWDVHDQGTPVPDYKYNASFFILTEDFEFRKYSIDNSTGSLNYGSKNYEITTLPAGRPGFLLVTYRSGNDLGMNIMPWGLGSLAVAVTFGANPAGNVWTATDFRHVTVDQMSYQAKIICWSLKGYQTWTPAGGS
ncbi:MAG: hypothetical protein JSV05_01140 [Candidatus Bathyarchaeota archaeon]|nr:MAG: hypothetical protein JSV05_01140 [Candidatus Bathyarchaeota archaeon]